MTPYHVTISLAGHIKWAGRFKGSHKKLVRKILIKRLMGLYGFIQAHKFDIRIVTMEYHNADGKR